MKLFESWSEKVVDREQNEQNIYDICFRPDGAQMVVAAGNRVLIYDPLDGTLIKALPGHKESVYCLSYADDGSHFASGGADKMVIIWTAELEGSLRFHHNDAIQALAFNPKTNVLLACAVSDFSLWSFNDQKVPKIKVNSRITCCSWTNDGQSMALGFFNGCVQIRDKNGDEKVKIERPDASNSPIWSLQWRPSKTGDILAIADWGQKVSFYQINGKQASKDRKLGFDATQLSWHSNGDYLIISGSNKQCGIYSAEGIKLHTICEKSSWVMCAKHKPDSNFIAVGCQDGTISMYQFIMTHVHSLYKDRYAYREGMSDVLVQNLVTGAKVKIRCKDLVKKLAVYKNRLAVQLSDKVIIYEIDSNDPKDMNYKGKKNISKKFDCNLFFITHENLIICENNRLECLNLKGEKLREWSMEFQVRYMKVIGGTPGKESLLVGLKSGHVFQIFVDSAFPVLLIKQENVIKHIDISMNRRKLAVIDDNLTLFVYNLKTGDLLFQEPNANSVAWNSIFEDLLAYSGEGNVNVNILNHTVQRQRLQGFVVGFNGTNIFYLNSQSVSSIEIAQSNGMYHYLERKQFKEAYDIACLGVTFKDWETLGYAALESYQIDVARRAFIRIRNYKMLSLIYQFQEMKRQGNTKNDILLGYLNAYQSKFSEAAKYFRKAGDENMAMSMFTDLRMFDMAKEYMTGADTDKNGIILKQAEWAIRNGDPKTAAELYISVKQFNKAIEIAGKNNWPEMLLEIVRKLDKADRESLSKCGDYFKKMNLANFAGEVYEKMGNIKELIDLRIEALQWDEVFALAKRYPDLDNMAHYKYGQWLAENDRFEEAQKAFNDAGFKKEAIKVLEELTYNAVAENRFNDASYYYWLLSNEYLQIVSDEPNDYIREKSLRKFHKYQHLAEMYFVYQHVHSYVVEPFTEHSTETLFNAAKYLIHELSKGDQIPAGISKFKILFTSLKMGNKLQAYKFARNIIERLDEIVINNRYSEQIDQIGMAVKAKPFKDEEELLSLCYRCSHHNPLLSQKGNDCNNCGQPFVFSFASFEPLPLVEFILPDDISDEEALSLIDYVPNSQFDKDPEKRYREAVMAGMSTSRSVNRLVLNDEPLVDKDQFVSLMNKYNTNSNDYRPVIVNRDVLRSIDPTHVFICKWPAPLRWKFFKIILTNEPLTMCNYCNRFFHTEDYELNMLKKGSCSFCRRSRDGSYKKSTKE